MIGTIVTLGGGGFSMSEDGASAIDDRLLELTGVSRPRVCFVPTASGDAADYCNRFEAAFAHRAETSVLSLFGQDPWGYADAEMLLTQDLIYVGGGSTANLLALWRLHGLPEVLRTAATNGTVLAGISAGMNCWFDASSTDSYGPLRPLHDGLGFLPGSACPHYRGQADRREKLHQWIATGALAPGYAIDDFAAAVFTDGQLVDAIADREGSSVFRIDRGNACVVETELPTRLLSSG
ncbi:Type 1 glutamine amidotransferase-like domain-containing protein [Enemella sp. A6]|uniref:Type 1 glutamine amidotransferase-like domain-containing protein n=1 Tax=Enemella sp. A6 TaxID=3440152 RepID=UPI003EB8E744